MLQLGIRTGHDLRQFRREELDPLFRQGRHIFLRYCPGRDFRPVEASHVRKSIGSETTLEQDTLRPAGDLRHPSGPQSGYRIHRSSSTSRVVHHHPEGAIPRFHDDHPLRHPESCPVFTTRIFSATFPNLLQDDRGWPKKNSSAGDFSCKTHRERQKTSSATSASLSTPGHPTGKYAEFMHRDRLKPFGTVHTVDWQYS